jgi:hypothetical protein
MGIQTTARTTADTWREQYRQRIATLESDGRYSDDGRRAAIAAEFVSAQRNFATLRAAHEDEIHAQRMQLHDSLFHLPDGVDPDAHRRVLDVLAGSSAEQLQQRLLTAERVGDEVTAHAILVTALERANPAGDRIAEQYAAWHPGAGERIQGLKNFESQVADPSDRMFSPFSVARPGILAKVNDVEVRRLAAEVAPELGTPTGTPPVGTPLNSGLQLA